MAVTSVRVAASSAPVGLVIIIVFVILAAVVFTKRRTRAKLKRIELERYGYLYALLLQHLQRECEKGNPIP